MRGLQITCLILAVTTLSIQSVRHVYVKYFETTASVLDRFEKREKAQLSVEIEQAKSLDELVAKYAPARKRTETLDAEMEEAVVNVPAKDRDDVRREFRRAHSTEYDAESTLKSAITDWETRTGEIRELRVFWAFGAGLFLVGCALYLKSPWLGMALAISGVVEMIWWSSPSFRFAGSPLEFERLLFNKLVFTNITLVLVIAAWLVLSAVMRKRAAAAI